MPKPRHIIACEGGNGYNITLPETPNVSAHCAEAADIMPMPAAIQAQVSLERVNAGYIVQNTPVSYNAGGC